MVMTLDEAITHCIEVADQNEYQSCKECAKEHRQLAKWLTELKTYRKLIANADKLIESEYGVVIIEGV